MAQEDSPRLSPELQAAQARLRQLRAERGIMPRSAGFLSGKSEAESTPWEGGERDSAAPAPPNWPLLNAQKELQRHRASTQYPVVSGQWSVVSGRPLDVGSTAPPPAVHATPPRALIVHPTMLLAILRRNREAPARVWLLLRHLDCDGRGWVMVEDARPHLTGRDSPLRVCGWRRLRQLLAEGEGTFWRRDDSGRLWLRGAHKVAHALDCDKLQGFPVELPLETLLGGIGDVRAAFYATFHSGRRESPISRDTLEALSGIPGRTQLEYDRAARVTRRRNMAVGERYTAERLQERAWERGRAAFRFIDTAGRQGRAGGEYVAWHLPNSYEGPYARRAKGGRKRLNRKLADLVKNGIPGNDGTAVERVFWPDGAAAAKGFNRGPEKDAYWRRDGIRAGGRLWCVIGKRGRE